MADFDLARFRAGLWAILLFSLLSSLPAEAAVPDLSPDQMEWLGQRIFANECNRSHACLTSWNEGEDFPSLGIGHFIWYRAGQQQPFAETFPALVTFMQARGATIPPWLAANGYEQPWPDRAAFLAASTDARMLELRELLAATTGLQTAFIVSRSAQALDQLLAAVPEGQHPELRGKYATIAAAVPPLGWYALIDYVHFKGEGTQPGERYQGEGWGLLQVLQGMPQIPSDPLQEFVASARQVLAERVRLAPAERQEQRWLAGWNKRLDTYLDPGLSVSTD